MGRPTKGVTAADRLAARLSPPDSAGCMLWLGDTDWNEYGRLEVDGRKVRAHRLAYELHHGVRLKPDQLVLHRCDRTRCCTPDHLFLGTQRQNMADMRAKGRAACGTRQPAAKLTDDLVRYIRSSSAKGVELARELDVAETTISRVRRRTVWRHV